MAGYQRRVIVGGVNGENGLSRKPFESVVYLRPLGLITDAKSVLFVRRQTTYQADETGKEKQKQERQTDEWVPPAKEHFPNGRHHQHISPEKELRIIPVPRSKADERAEYKHRDRREQNLAHSEPGPPNVDPLGKAQVN